MPHQEGRTCDVKDDAACGGPNGGAGCRPDGCRLGASSGGRRRRHADLQRGERLRVRARLLAGHELPFCCARSQLRALCRQHLEIRRRYRLHPRRVWTVFAPSGTLAPGALAGGYAGGTASATVVVGVGANALIGGGGNSIALQPLSIEANRGLNVAAGIGAMTLTP